MPTKSKSDAKLDSETRSETRTLFAIKQNSRRQSANSDYSGIQNAILRLSDKEYQLLTKFRSDYPNLNVELMGKPANGFILYRSHFVAEFKRKEKGMKEKEGADESKESTSTNQKDLSKLAGITWKAILPSEREPYLIRADEAKKLWVRMYPNGLSGTLVAYIKALKSKSKPREQKPSLSSSSRRKFQPLPSPPVSDDIDFREDMMEEDENNAFDEQAFSDDDDDKEYSPRLKTNKQARSSGNTSSSRRCLKRRFMTPESMTRELTPPIPTFSDPDVLDFDPPHSAFRNVSLAQLNDDSPSTFTDPHVFLGSFATSYTSGYPQQIAVGYSHEDHAKNTIIDWNQNDLMSDLDHTTLYPINNTPYCPESYMADPMNELA